MLTWQNVIDFTNQGTPSPNRKIVKTEDEWRNLLSPEAFRITRQKGTERPFSSQMCELFEPGRYACVCCDTLLFDAQQKFDSGTGWPSFTQPVEEKYHCLSWR